MGVLCLFKSSDDKASAFCKCKQRRHTDLPVQCHCGEEDSSSLEWSWDTNVAHPEAQISAVNVIFHPVYSQGTCVIRGDGTLQKQCIHYWEIKIISCFSGTDLVSYLFLFLFFKPNKYLLFIYCFNIDDWYWYR